MSEARREYSSSVIDTDDMRELIEFRKIQPEDYSIIENLSKFTKSELISNFHNYFLFLQEGSAEDLQRQINHQEKRLEKDPENEDLRRVVEMCRWYLEICNKYDWAVANNINRVLERN